MGRFPTGVALLTRGCGTATEVMTVNCVTSVSLDPLLILVGVRAGGRMHAGLSAGGTFAVNMLTEVQQDLSVLFARPDRPRGQPAADRLGAVAGQTGNAVLPSALAALECAVQAEYPGGDHVLFLGHVVAIHASPDEVFPLVFYQRAYPSLRLGQDVTTS
jgi:flavin reductase (DIM6/NTAB) family NADH-FMN oxidoreductase RutF